MVSEVERPHCHSKVVPKSRFSAFTFATLLFLGILPFILTLTSYLLVFDVFRLMLEKKPEAFSYSPPPSFPIPSEITQLMQRATTLIIMLSFSYLLLTLIVGIIPAVVYLAVRRGSYKCPECNLPMD